MPRNPVSILALLLALAVPLSSSFQTAPAELPTRGAAGKANKADLVMFNQSSKKYHCPSCRWAKECTRNCVEITRAEALRLGGVACKTCKGRCAE